MLVKLRDPSKVYYCREQRLSLAGAKPVETKVTFHVRQLLQQGEIVEVVKVEKVEAPKEEPKEEPKLTPAQVAIAKKKAEAAAKKVETA